MKRSASRIPPRLIEEVNNRTDLVSLIGSRVKLTQSGDEYKACCPFHSENTPSFFVVPEKGFYHCFGCGAHGDAVDFIVDYHGASFQAAVKELAKNAGLIAGDLDGAEMPLPGPSVKQPPREPDDLPSPPPPPEVAERIGRQLVMANRHFQSNRARSRLAQEYLSARGIDAATADEFGIGFADGGQQDNLRRASGGGSAYEALAESGLIVRNDRGGKYDRFRQRLMFPIRDADGALVGFGGRRLDDEGRGPKYLNSPETAVFRKRQILYGLCNVLKNDPHGNRLLVVEGYIDVVSLYQHGIPFAVAPQGTSVTPVQIRQMAGLGRKITFCFDGDLAGQRAVARTVERILSARVAPADVDFLLLPPGEDPDSLVRSGGASGFAKRLLLEPRSLVGAVADIATGRIARDASEVDKSDPWESAKQWLDRLPPHMHPAYREELSRITGESDRAIRSRFAPGKPALGEGGPGSLQIVLGALLSRPSLARRLQNLDQLGGMPTPLEDLVDGLRSAGPAFDVNAFRLRHADVIPLDGLDGLDDGLDWPQRLDRGLIGIWRTQVSERLSSLKARLVSAPDDAEARSEFHALSQQKRSGPKRFLRDERYAHESCP